MLKVAELMAEASFIQKRIEALKVEQELSNAQARVYGTLWYPILQYFSRTFSL